MSSRLTKRQLRTGLGLTTDAEIASFYGITASAVSQWDEDGPIPELRQLQAEQKKPDLVRSILSAMAAPPVSQVGPFIGASHEG